MGDTYIIFKNKHKGIKKFGQYRCSHSDLDLSNVNGITFDIDNHEHIISNIADEDHHIRTRIFNSSLLSFSYNGTDLEYYVSINRFTEEMVDNFTKSTFSIED